MLPDPKEARAGITEVHFLPFNPVDKRTAITYIDQSGNWHRVSKGAPEQAGELKPDNVELSEQMVSNMPQTITPTKDCLVRHLLQKKISTMISDPQFNTDVMKPLQIEQLMDQYVMNLSGGELQRVALCFCLGKPADIYMIDEPSAYLDSEQRVVASKVIMRFILHNKKTAFVAIHDFIMATYLADRVIVYEGTPAVDCVANAPQSLLSGMNLFLSVSVAFIAISLIVLHELLTIENPKNNIAISLIVRIS